MAIKTTLEQLEEVQTAITTIITQGQGVTKGDRSVTLAKLATLQDRETALLKRYRAETGTGGIAINTGVTKRL